MKKIQKMLLLIVASFMMITGVNAEETLQSKIDVAGKNKTTITLDKNYTESITINNEQDIILDLNGYTLTGHVIDTGTLTVKSSKTGGKIVAPYLLYVGMYSADKDTKEVLRNDAGKFILESGTIEVTGENYGIYCMSGSTAIINGGTINSMYSGIAGNNTTGTMHFEVNGGVINTEVGPSIYMPGPVDLKVTGGTLNGGISLRMGKIDISGGVINAGTKNFASFEKQYNESGNPAFTDAIYVLGGTYTSKDSSYTNELVLNITGGTINVTNTQGSAVAIYDMGKVEQKMSVNISGDAKLITNSTTRNAYDVLTLTEAGVTNIKTGYNNPEFVGKVSTEITGGTFSSSVAKYITNEYVETKVENEYVVAKKEVVIETPTIDTTKEVKEVTIGVKEDKTINETLQEALKADEKLAEKVKDINAVVDVTIKNQEEKVVPKEANEAIVKLAEEIKTEKKVELKVASFFDITLNVKNNVTGENLGTLTTLGKKVAFNVALPEELTKVEEGYTRTYYIVRYHDGKAEILDTELNGKVLTFETDKFSTYAIAYEDVKTVKEETVVNPPTGDKIVLDLVVGIVSVAGLGLVAKSIAKRKKYFN